MTLHPTHAPQTEPHHNSPHSESDAPQPAALPPPALPPPLTTFLSSSSTTTFTTTTTAMSSGTAQPTQPTQQPHQLESQSFPRRQSSVSTTITHPHHQTPQQPPPSLSSDSLNSQTLPRLLDPTLSHLRDVTLLPARSPGRTLHAHRFVLASASPVLRASLSADPAATTLTLSHADADALDAALQFVYGRPEALARLPSHALWTALATCVAYAIVQPLDALQKRIVQVIDLHNVFYHWGMGDKYNLDVVVIACRNLVKSQFRQVATQPEFLDVGPQRLARVLRIHDLAVNNGGDGDGEDVVFEALETWLAFDVGGRAEQALQLLRLVRLPTMSDKTLLRVCRSPYFGGHNEFYQLLLEALIRRTEVRIVHAPRVTAIEEQYKEMKLAIKKKPAIVNSGSMTGATTTTTTTATDGDGDGSDGDLSGSMVVSHFKPLGISDDQLLPCRMDPSANTKSVGSNKEKDGQMEKMGARGVIDYNRKEDRTVLFEGMFPLRWYKSVRFRPRSCISLLFSVVIPKWSTCRRRFISESRSFLNHKWSLWVDPLPSASSSSSNIEMTSSANDEYISIYLCCESEMTGSQKVNARVDFALFVVSATEDYGMERKICVGRTFKSHGQAMGFRRHTKRSRILHKHAALYNADKDELVVGAHVIAGDAKRLSSSSSSSAAATTGVKSALAAVVDKRIVASTSMMAKSGRAHANVNVRRSSSAQVGEKGGGNGNGNGNDGASKLGVSLDFGSGGGGGAAGAAGAASAAGAAAAGAAGASAGSEGTTGSQA